MAITDRLDDIDEYYLQMAELVARRGTCRRRQVGAVLVDERGHVLATGYSGVPAGLRHCLDHPCAGADAPPGESLDLCLATHAEQNALVQCTRPEQIFTCYTTASPCVHCVKMLMNTPCLRIVFREEYPHPESRALWMTHERIVGDRFMRGLSPEWSHRPRQDPGEYDVVVGLNVEAADLSEVVSAMKKRFAGDPRVKKVKVYGQ